MSHPADPAPGPALAHRLLATARTVPDFPTAGVQFKDLGPVFGDADLFAQIVGALATPYRGVVDEVVGIESRGFIVGAAVARELGVGLVLLRKAGKLPPPTRARGYDLEYGSATIEVNPDLVGDGRRLVIVDDVLATGGTARAACDLVESVGGQVAGLAVLIELAFLAGREQLPGRRVDAIATC